MAEEEEDKKKKHTVESLFPMYANFRVIPIDVDNEEHDKILLSQIDYWLGQAKLLNTVISQVETGLAYMKYKKWRLDIEEFEEFLIFICRDKAITVDEVKTLLVEAGPPGGGEMVIVR